MTRFSSMLTACALACLCGLGVTLAPARADRVKVHCDGDQCERIVCDDAGANCWRSHFINHDDQWQDVKEHHGYHQIYDHQNDQRWVCGDEDRRDDGHDGHREGGGDRRHSGDSRGHGGWHPRDGYYSQAGYDGQGGYGDDRHRDRGDRRHEEPRGHGHDKDGHDKDGHDKDGGNCRWTDHW
ncbi:MAG: hypothetical protein WCA81_10625 [Rhizomicrobium sp.]